MNAARNLKLSLVALLGLTSLVASASYMGGVERVTGGDGFRIVKSWGGSAGTGLRIEYYGLYAATCNAGPSSSGPVNRLTFNIVLNGRHISAQETSCGQYDEPGRGLRTFTIVELNAGDGRSGMEVGDRRPQLFDGLDPRGTWTIELWIQAVTGEWDSRYGQNYHFEI